LLPAVIIEPLLSVDDIKEVNTQITLLKERKTGHIKLGFEEKSKQDNKEEINSNNNTLFYFGLINQILNEFIFETDLIAHDMQGLIEYVSKLPTKSKATQDKVLNELMKRETYGSTFIDQAGLLLLHCKAEQLTSLGIVRLDKPTEFKVGGTPQKVRAALLMIVPEHADERLVDLFGAISKNVVLDSDLLFTMITRPKEEILNKISNVFSQFIK
jgi:mannitol operon transcriptional antiterminator